jgi:mannose-6-phosphate isomerase
MVLDIRRTGPVDLARDLLRWMKRDALPFWADAGLNPKTCLFHERLSSTGEPDWQAPLRMRVQFRQIYTLSHAAVLGWFPQGASIALAAWRHLMKAAYAPDGEPGFAHLLSAEARIVDPRRDSYDHAFAVLAAAWLLRATGDAGVRRTLEELLSFVDEHLTDAHGALREGRPNTLPNRQNPQMHWFEAMLALCETDVHTSGASRALHHRRFAEERLFDAGTGMLCEYFSADWQPLAGDQGEVVEPGHLAEWVWLLRRHDALSGEQPSALAGKLMQAGLRFRCSKHNLLVDEGRRDGGVRRGTRRIWLQTELLKAHLSEYEAGDMAAHDHALSCLTALDRHYLRKPFTQGWIDQLDEQARPVDAPVPASILYHLFVALAEVERVLLLPSVAIETQRRPAAMIAAG